MYKRPQNLSVPLLLFLIQFIALVQREPAVCYHGIATVELLGYFQAILIRPQIIFRTQCHIFCWLYFSLRGRTCGKYWAGLASPSNYQNQKKKTK